MRSHSTHTFSQIFIHLNWHCNENRPNITPHIESDLYKFIEKYCVKSKGVLFHAVGGIEDHIHLVIQIEPTLLLSEWIGKVKGASAHEMNVRFGKGTLEWQRGYGAVSFAKRDLPSVLKYVKNQKLHHRKGTVNAVLEDYGDSE